MDLKPAERAILVDLKIYGDDKAANISNRTGFHRNTISARMGDLTEESLVANKGGGVYRLRDRGRREAINLIESGELPYSD